MYLSLNSDEKICIMSTSMTVTDLCAIKQSVKIKNAFADIIYNVLVGKTF